MYSRKTKNERFDDKFSPEPMSGCWIWTAYVNPNGYGLFTISHNNSIVAHRFSYQRYRGPIPAGLDLDHLCRVRCCVNPWHLEAVTRKENLRRGYGAKLRKEKLALYRSRLYCDKGHKMIPDNVFVDRTAVRCRTCHNEWQRAYKKRVRQAEKLVLQKNRSSED